jgi:sodium/hydrogen antiporter
VWARRWTPVRPRGNDRHWTGANAGRRRSSASPSGIGSIYYLAYAAGEANEFDADWLWSTVSFAIVLSVFVHGILASPVMKRIGVET